MTPPEYTTELVVPEVSNLRENSSIDMFQCKYMFLFGVLVLNT